MAHSCQCAREGTVLLSHSRHKQFVRFHYKKKEVQPFPAQWSFCVSPCLWWSILGISLRWPNFDPRSVHMRFMVDKVALWQVFSQHFCFFSCQYHSTRAPYSPSSYRLPLPGQMGEAWEPSKKAILFGKSGSTGYRSTYFHIAFKRLTLEARTVIPQSDSRWMN